MFAAYGYHDMIQGPAEFPNVYRGNSDVWAALTRIDAYIWRADDETGKKYAALLAATPRPPSPYSRLVKQEKLAKMREKWLSSIRAEKDESDNKKKSLRRDLAMVEGAVVQFATDTVTANSVANNSDKRLQLSVAQVAQLERQVEAALAENATLKEQLSRTLGTTPLTDPEPVGNPALSDSYSL